MENGRRHRGVEQRLEENIATIEALQRELQQHGVGTEKRDTERQDASNQSGRWAKGA